MRGLFTAGVLDVMMENGIEYSGMIGVSAGATFGCNYKSRQIGRTLRYNKRFAKDWRYCSVRSLIQTGDLYGAEFCYHILPSELDKFDTRTFRENPMEFYVVCTDVKTGRPVYQKLTEGESKDLEWIRASASMPVVSRPVEVDGYTLLDGGIADSVPIRFFEQAGYDRNVVVLTQPASYVKKKSSMMPIFGLLLSGMPAVLKAMEERPEVYNETLAYIREKEEAGTLFVIRPSEKLDIGKTEHDPEKMEAVYLEGRKEGEKRLPALKLFLEGREGGSL